MKNREPMESMSISHSMGPVDDARQEQAFLQTSERCSFPPTVMTVTSNGTPPMDIQKEALKCAYMALLIINKTCDVHDTPHISQCSVLSLFAVGCDPPWYSGRKMQATNTHDVPYYYPSLLCSYSGRPQTTMTCCSSMTHAIDSSNPIDSQSAVARLFQ